MIEAITYENLIENLIKKYGTESKCVIGILLGNSNSPFMREGILSRIDYYHHRSGNNIDFYFPGYGAYWYNECGKQEIVCSIENVDWLFSSKLYSDFIEKIENQSKWKYSGETELLLLTFSNGELNFKEVMIFWLDKMVEKGIIYSPSNFFEEIFRLFKKKSSVYYNSDILTIKGIGNDILEIVKDKIPILKMFTRNKWFCIKNISKKRG